MFRQCPEVYLRPYKSKCPIPYQFIYNITFNYSVLKTLTFQTRAFLRCFIFQSTTKPVCFIKQVSTRYSKIPLRQPPAPDRSGNFFFFFRKKIAKDSRKRQPN